MSLKDFQRRTVDYVFHRLYGPDPTLRFLVADEVGLGKTLVARGVIARTLEHLRDKVDRVDVIYVCSNATIASQNLQRLNVLPPDEAEATQTEFATRLTLLPLHVHGLKKNRINFVSFTPGTTFAHKSSGGTAPERTVIWMLLRGRLPVDGKGLFRLLRCGVGWPNWKWRRKEDWGVDEDIAEDYAATLLADAPFLRKLEAMCEDFVAYGRREPPEGLSARRYAMVGELRRRLAERCLDALQPDLVILDEFQRFEHLLDSRREDAQLAWQLFRYAGNPEWPVRVLLLSATPYKMYTVTDSDDEDHYQGLVKTLRFLLDEEEEPVRAVEEALRALREALYGLRRAEDDGPIIEAAARVSALLRRVMVRTERVRSTAQRDAMIATHRIVATPTRSDLEHAVSADALARALGAGDVIEYWKSAPYLVNYLRGYELGRRLRKQLDAPSEEVVQAIREGRRHQIKLRRVRKYAALEAGNPRLRCLLDDLLNQRALWKLLWMPPALPYYEPQGAYAEAGPASKALIFSAWNAVPDAIASLASYEAERRMLGAVDFKYEELTRKRRGLLRFVEAHDDSGPRLTGMYALALMYPSPVLAEAGDPLRWLDEIDGSPMPLESLMSHIRAQLSERLPAPSTTEGAIDRRWIWASPVLLDGPYEWTTARKGWRVAGDDPGHEHGDTAFDKHIEAMAAAATLTLGRPPEDLLDTLTLLALGSPAVCALRAVHRVCPELAIDEAPLLSAAARIANGFRTLFNVPESMGLLRRDDDGEGYWREALRHCVEGNLQAVLDEHVHTLRESLGLFDAPPAKRAKAIADALSVALSVRTSTVEVDEIRVAKGRLKADRNIRLRTRFALRFGDLHDDERRVARASVVRTAFNAPFRPFVLASTSVGQEGLDFHTWCHVIYHWNLPTNPVDLEQREGRVHRYKGYAIRKTLAQRYGLDALRASPAPDPWNTLFERASDDRRSEDELEPYWILDEGVKIARRVPLLPWSKDAAHFARLERSLALYRLAFGQPRQEDLVAWLEQRLGAEVPEERLAAWQIDLRPPKVEE